MSEEQSLYDQVISSLTEITEQFGDPVYIIIDELDRCRPDFALETLERIKHIFHVKSVKFILVYNETVLMSMINNRYGPAIDTQRYLTKFVERKYLFDNTKSLELWIFEEIRKGKEKFANTFMPEFLHENHDLIQKIRTMFNLSLRDIQQIINNLKSYGNIGDVYDFIIILNIEFLRCVKRQEFSNMVAYYEENNKHFAVNAPDRYTFAKIFNGLAKTIPGGMPMSSDEAFYKYARNYV
jgi:uncharacterized protein YehS (DUF1456 family)